MVVILRWHPEVGRVSGPDLTNIRSNIDNKNVSYKPNSARFDCECLLLLGFKSLHFRHGENFHDPFTNKVLHFQNSSLEIIPSSLFKAITQVDHYGSLLESEPIKRRIRSRNDDSHSQISHQRNRNQHKISKDDHDQYSKRNEHPLSEGSYHPTSRLSKSYFRTEKF